MSTPPTRAATLPSWTWGGRISRVRTTEGKKKKHTGDGKARRDSYTVTGHGGVPRHPTVLDVTYQACIHTCAQRAVCSERRSVVSMGFISECGRACVRVCVCE